MLVACWSPKGGSGTTVVAAALAVVLARAGDADGALLVDLAGDLPLALGVAPLDSPGVADWLAAAPDVPADAVARIEVPVSPGVALLHRGRGPLPPASAGADLLAAVLAADRRPVVADCGRLDPWPSPGDAVARAVVAAADRSLAVLRPCFLGLWRATHRPAALDGVVLVDEPGRSLRAADVEASAGAPVVARVRVTDQVARAVDSGLLLRRTPRSLLEDLRRAA